MSSTTDRYRAGILGAYNSADYEAQSQRVMDLTKKWGKWEQARYVNMQKKRTRQ